MSPSAAPASAHHLALSIMLAVPLNPDRIHVVPENNTHGAGTIAGWWADIPSMQRFRLELMQLLTEDGPCPLDELLYRHQRHFNYAEQLPAPSAPGGPHQGLKNLLSRIAEIEMTPFVREGGVAECNSFTVLLSHNVNLAELGSSASTATAGAAMAATPSQLQPAVSSAADTTVNPFGKLWVGCGTNNKCAFESNDQALSYFSMFGTVCLRCLRESSPTLEDPPPRSMPPNLPDYAVISGHRLQWCPPHPPPLQLAARYRCLSHQMSCSLSKTGRLRPTHPPPA